MVYVCPEGNKGLMSVDEVAGYLGLGRVTVYRWCREGQLPCLKVGKSWRVRRGALEENGLEVKRLESEGRFRLVPERRPVNDRGEALQNLLKEVASLGGAVWASFDWTEAVDLDAALEQQEEMAQIVGDSQLVVKTAVLEEISDAWPLEERRRARATHCGTLWLSDRGVTLGRFVPLSPN